MKGQKKSRENVWTGTVVLVLSVLLLVTVHKHLPEYQLAYYAIGCGMAAGGLGVLVIGICNKEEK